MATEVDSGLGQSVGSHIRMAGKVFGLSVSLDEVIIESAPPRLKVWETVGQPKLLVIDHYRPKRSAWLGKLFGGFYAKRFINPGTRSRTRRLCRVLLSPED